MEAKNFRIGNWIYDKTFKKEIQFKSFYGLCNIENNIDNYKPIPLTEEWLLKFGFEKQMAWTYRIHMFGDKWLVVYLGQKGWSINNKNYPDFMKLDYVHQLQNLFFAITGEELKLTETVWL